MLIRRRYAKNIAVNVNVFRFSRFHQSCFFFLLYFHFVCWSIMWYLIEWTPATNNNLIIRTMGVLNSFVVDYYVQQQITRWFQLFFPFRPNSHFTNGTIQFIILTNTFCLLTGPAVWAQKKAKIGQHHQSFLFTRNELCKSTTVNQQLNCRFRSQQIGLKIRCKYNCLLPNFKLDFSLCVRKKKIKTCIKKKYKTESNRNKLSLTSCFTWLYQAKKKFQRNI